MLHGLMKLSTKGIQKSGKQTLMGKKTARRDLNLNLIWSGIMQMTTLFHVNFHTSNMSRILKSIEHLSPQKDMKL